MWIPFFVFRYMKHCDVDPDPDQTIEIMMSDLDKQVFAHEYE